VTRMRSAMHHDQVDPFGAVSESALETDLHLLMRGPGARPGQDMSRIGPALRTMCGIAASDSPADAIAAVAAWLRARISALGSERHRIYASLAFGLDETALLPWARNRLAATAESLGHSVDTARRAALAAVTTIARATTPNQSVPLQLRRHSGSWIDLGMAIGATPRPEPDARLGAKPDPRPPAGHDARHHAGHEAGHVVVTARCFLIVVARPVDHWDKVYAVVHYGAHNGNRRNIASAIPAVRVRHVTPAPDTNKAPPNLHDPDQ
jgi:hypothetical protein